MFLRLAIIALAVIGIPGCHRAPYNEAEVRMLTMPNLHPTPRDAQPSTYLAADFGKRGQPKLGVRETRLVRKTLAVIKRCQRGLLRYAFVSDPEAQDMRIALFFARPGEQIFDVHVLWESNLVYNEGRAFAAPGPDPIPGDIRIDIAKTPCENDERIDRQAS